jgi:chromosome condensin MukBEF complex kleisin-like MukF subunit
MQDIADSANAPSRNLTDPIARTWAEGVSLQLDRERLAFLSGIQAFLELNADPMLGEAELRDVFSLLIVAPRRVSSRSASWWRACPGRRTWSPW